MIFKMALGNLKKSYKDYAIYFLTLLFSVSLFYIFGSFDSQLASLTIPESQLAYFKSISTILNGLSFVIAGVFAFLILYANQFMVKRRKKELGLYIMLGMSYEKTTSILFTETLLMGIISFVVGIGVGILGSQVLAYVTSLMIQAPFTLKWFFSVPAMIATLIAFSIIFLIVMLFNGVILNKVSLLDLFQAQRKNETPAIKHPALLAIIFLLGTATLVYAYKLALTGYTLIESFLFVITLGIIGTFGLFYGLSGMIALLISKNKGYLYHNVRMFNARQIVSKLATTSKMMATLSLMLLFGMGTLISGFTLASAFQEEVKDSLPVSATINYYGDEKLQEPTLPVYRVDDQQTPQLVIRARDLESFSGQTITLKPGEAMKYKSNSDYVLPGIVEVPSTITPFASYMFHEDVWVVDSYEGATPQFEFINAPKELSDTEAKAWAETFVDDHGSSYATVKEEMINAQFMLTITLTYTSMYLAIVFLVTTAVLLALQQLSEVTDNQHRYDILNKMGVDSVIQRRSLFTQIATYFAIPLAIGILHTTIGVKAIFQNLGFIGMNTNQSSAMAISIVVIGLIYGGYFLITYVTSKRMIGLDS